MRSCALVGSGGSLLTAKAGSFIDSFDIVARFNWAPIRGYEEFVGNRTSVRIINTANSIRILQQIEKELIAKGYSWAKGSSASLKVLQKCKNSDRFLTLRGKVSVSCPSSLTIINSRYPIVGSCLQSICSNTRGIHEYLRKERDTLDRIKKISNKNINSGIFGLIVLKHFCGMYPTVLFGFDGSRANSSYHYYENCVPDPNDATPEEYRTQLALVKKEYKNISFFPYDLSTSHSKLDKCPNGAFRVCGKICATRSLRTTRHVSLAKLLLDRRRFLRHRKQEITH